MTGLRGLAFALSLCAIACGDTATGGSTGGSGGTQNSGAAASTGAGGNGDGDDDSGVPITCSGFCALERVETCTDPQACADHCEMLTAAPCSNEGRVFLECIAKSPQSACEASECLDSLESWLSCTGGPMCNHDAPCDGSGAFASCVEQCLGVIGHWAYCTLEEVGTDGPYSCYCGYADEALGTCMGEPHFDGCCSEFLQPYGE